MDYYIHFAGIIEQSFCLRLAQAIEKAKANPLVTQIIILFSSVGGDIREGFLLATLIQNSPKPIIMHATNNIDSIANVIYLSSKQRTAESYAKFYMHGASANGSFDEKALQDQLSATRANNTRIAYFVSENCNNLSLVQVQSLMKAGTTIPAQKALEYDIVHEIKHREIPPGALQEDIIAINWNMSNTQAKEKILQILKGMGCLDITFAEESDIRIVALFNCAQLTSFKESLPGWQYSGIQIDETGTRQYKIEFSKV